MYIFFPLFKQIVQSIMTINSMYKFRVIIVYIDLRNFYIE